MPYIFDVKNRGVTRMYNKKNIASLIVLWVFIAQIVFMNGFSPLVSATESVSESVYENVPTRQILMEPAVESKLIGDVNGDGNRDSIDFAFMRMVLLGLKNSFPILNGTWASDTDGNGVFNAIDFAYMRKLLLGFISILPAEATPTPTITNTLIETFAPTPTSTPTPKPTETITPTQTAKQTQTTTPALTPAPAPTITSTGSLDNEKPTVPSDLHYITKTESSVILAWNRSNDNVGVVGYDIYRDNECIASTEGNAFTVSGLEKSKSYGFTVKAKDAAGNYSDAADYIVVTIMDTIKTSKYKKVVGGYKHVLALKEDGTVWSWGRNSHYQLGIGPDEKSSEIPVQVLNLTDIKDIEAGYQNSLALRDDGTVWAWGVNSYSNCGVKYNGSNYRISEPVKVNGIKDVEQICATMEQCFALKDGMLWGWGNNNEQPKILEQFSDVKSISSDKYRAIIVLENDGDIYRFTDDKSLSKELKLVDVQKAILVNSYIFALKKDGTVWFESIGSEKLIQVPDIKNVKDIASDYRDCLFLMKDGTVFEYVLSDITSYYSVAKKSALPTKINELEYIESIGSGENTKYAIKEDNTLFAWDSDCENLGNGLVIQNYPANTYVEYINENGYKNRDKDVSDNYCGRFELLDDGTVKQIPDIRKPSFKLQDISDVVNIYANEANFGAVLALKADGTVWAWGKNGFGQLGDGSNNSSFIPVQVANLSEIIDIKVGQEHVLALKADGTVWAWGKNDYGQLGDGSNIQSLTPKEVKDISGVISIAVGDNHSLALKADGTVWAWGANDSGQLGNNGIGACLTPVKVIGLNNVLAIMAGYDRSMFINHDMSIWKCGSWYTYSKPVRVTSENDANLRFITINNSFLECFNEDITDYNLILPVGTTIKPEIHVRTYNPNATYDIIRPDNNDGIAIIKVTAPDGVTEKEYRIQFNKSSYEEYKESYHFGESGTGASGNFSRTYTDMTADAPGFKLVFSRTYNSKDMKIGALGRGWTFGFESKIEDTGTVGLKKLTLPDGSVNLFKWNGSEYVAENSRNTLTLDASDTYLLTTKDQYTYHYNKRGHLNWMKDKNGNTVSIDVSTAGKVNSITDQCGREYKVDYENGMIKCITDVEGGRKVEYTYKEGNLRQVKDACNSITYYNYSGYTFDKEIGSVDLLSQVRDDDNKIIEFIDCYDEGENKGKVKQTVDQNGNELTYNYYPDESRNTVTDSNGKMTSNWYDESYYNVITVDSERGFSKTTYYLDSKGENKYGEAKIVQDRNGNKTTYERDEVGNITKITNPDTGEKEFGYDSNNNIVWEKDEEGNFTQHVYSGNLLKQTAERFEKLTSNDRSKYPTVSEISADKYAIKDYDYYDYSSFNIYGLLKTETQNTGKESLVTEYNYHPNGNIKSVKNPQTGKLTLYSDVDYTPEYGWMTTETSPEGNITEYHYNDNGQLLETKKKDAKDAKKVSNTVTVYDDCGRKKQEVPANLYDKYIDEGNSPDIGIRYSYNTKGQLESMTDAEDNVTKYHSYDVYGNVQVEEKPNGGVYKYEYDSFSRLLKVWFKDTMETADSDYKLLVEYSYIAAQNPVKIEIKHLNDSEVARTTYKSDYAGRTVNITYPADASGQNPTAISKYYKNGELKEFTDKNGYTTYYNNGNFESTSLQKYDEKWTPVELEGTKVKYNYSKTYYDNAGRVVEEWTSSELVDKDAQSTTFIKKTTGYYKDGKVRYELYSDGRRKDYDYDFDRNLNKEITKKNDTENITVLYENNYFGKPDTKKLYVSKGDIYPNKYSDSGDEIIQTTYTYDKLGNVKTVETDNVYTEDDLTDSNIITYNYDNMGRNTGTEESVVTEDGTIKKLTNKSNLNWEGNPLTVQQLVNDVVTRTNTYEYNQRGLLETVTDAMPEPKTGVTYYGYDLAGRKVCEVAPNDYIANTPVDQLNRTVYAYDGLDKVLTVSYVGMMGNFDTSGNWVEPTKQSVILQKSYTYDKAGNVVREADGEGYETQYAYNPSNKVKAVLDPVSADNGIKLENAPQRFNYDALGRKVEEITTREEKNGTDYTKYDSSKIFVYDDAGNVKFIKSKKNSSASEITLEAAIYDYLGNATTKTDGNENATNYTYNNLGKVRSVVTPGDDNIKSNTVYYQYDKAGNLKETLDTKGTDDSKDDVYQFNKYDNRGKMLSSTIQKQDGTQKISTSASYDIYGNKHFETDGNLKTTTYNYNELNKLEKSSIDVYDVDKVKTTHTKDFDYDKNGNLLSETDHLNNSVTYTYDSLNRLREKKDQYQKSIQKLNYYPDNTQSESFDALNNKTAFKYDKNNKLASTTDAEYHAKSNTYDITGNVKTKDDGLAHITYYGYDEYGKLTEVSINVDEILQTTVYTYDLNGNMTSQRDAKLNKTIYNYNAANKLEKRYVEGQTYSEDYTYNADGSVYQKTDKNGVASTYTYYASGKLESQTIGNEGKEGYVKTVYIYDGNGNLINTTETTFSNGVSATIVTEREYDELNRAKTKTEYDSSTTAAKRVVNKFKYDIVPVANDLPGITASLEGTVGERSIISKNNVEMSSTLKVNDKAGRLKYIVANGQTTVYEYDDNGNRQSVSYPGGMKEEYVYYKDNLLQTLINYKTESGKQVQIDKYDYTYDAAHNQDTKDEFVNGVSKGKTIFVYDELNRLKTVTEPSLQLTEYKYDAAGNREKETVSTNGTVKTESTYGYNAMNWLQTLAKVDYNEGSKKTTNYIYNYDKNGNQTGVLADGVATVTYQYDNLNRLTKTTKEGKDYTYSFNADGLRVKKADAEGTTVYLYESQEVVMELDAAGNILANNVYGTNLLTRTVEGTTLYYMYNGHADVTALLDTKGSLVGSYYYDAWGNLLESSGSMKDKNSILYAGYQYDNETKLYYLNARMYDPKVARFLQEDTYRGKAANPLSLNLYTYCHNEPIMYIDPTGNTELRRLVEEKGGQVGWNENTMTASFSLNGVNKNYKVKNGKVYDDKNQNIGSIINGRVDVSERYFHNIFADVVEPVPAPKPQQTPKVTTLIDNGKYKIGSPKKPEWLENKQYDESYKYDPNEKPTDQDKENWGEWGVNNLGATVLSKIPSKVRKLIQEPINAIPIIEDRHKDMFNERLDVDLTDAARAYNHYRTGKGKDLKINYEKAYNQDENIRSFVDGEIQSAQEWAEKLYTEYGKSSFSITGELVPSTDYPATENWSKTIGAHFVWGSGDVSYNDGNFTMKIKIHEMDRYNFNPGMSDIATGAPDEINGRFTVLGWAHPFNTKGELTRIVNWQDGNISTTTKVTKK